MNITIKNLGPIKEADLELGNFTVITGKNNTGKTYLSYALYGFLKRWTRYVKKINEIDYINENLTKNGTIEIDLVKYEKEVINNLQAASSSYSNDIFSVFSANEDEFKSTVFLLNFQNEKITYKQSFEIEAKIKDDVFLKAERDKNHLLKININTSKELEFPYDRILSDVVNKIIHLAILNEFLPIPFVITSERTGINIFQKELDINKNVLFEKLIKASKDNKFKFDPFEFLDEVFDRYSLPIQDSIERTRNRDLVIRKKSFVAKEHPDIIKKFLKSLSGVGFKILNEGDRKEYYVTYKGEGKKREVLPLYLSSSSTRSLLDFYVYLKHIAGKNDILIIDEPELNLHPELQIQFTRILSSLVNIGIKVWITTHSDYIVKEINNLIMINNLEDKSGFEKKYNKLEFVSAEKLKFYITEENTVKKIETDEFGLKRTTFDKTIDEINKISEKLYDKINEQL